MSAPVLSAPTDLLEEQIRWSTAPTVLGQTEPAEPHNRTPDSAAPSDLVLLLETNRTRPGQSPAYDFSVSDEQKAVFLVSLSDCSECDSHAGD